jgi:hypothetical protein
MGIGRVRPRPPAVAIDPGLARHLDDLRAAEQAAALDRHFGRVPPPAGIFDNIDAPADPLAAQRAVAAAPRGWLERAALANALEPGPSPPLADMLLENERRRALIGSRLDRLTPEQQASSLPAVSRQYDADQAARRAAEVRRGQDMNTAAALAAGGLAGAGAFGLRMALESAQNEQDAMLMEAWRAERQGREAQQRGRQALAEVDRAVGEIDLSEDPPAFSTDYIYEPPPVSEPPLEAMLSEDTQLNLLPDSPDEAVAASPGPSGVVRQFVDLEDLPGPQKRSIMALMRGGIAERRAMDIILKGSSMSPDEYRMVTGGRR